jgi:predicted O-linked N-acetylglucosamine transferase (SPINDLY family)
MMVAFDANNAKQELIARGVEENRIVTAGRSAGMAYYKMHDQVDVALDTFPFNGLTVTCFAAWMGVPTLGFAARRPASRVGYSIASRLGLADVLIASSREELSTKARALAGDLKGLAQIRREMRARMSMGVANTVEWTREFEQRLMQLVGG